jgi:hypothetical protein
VRTALHRSLAVVEANGMGTTALATIECLWQTYLVGGCVMRFVFSIVVAVLLSFMSVAYAPPQELLTRYGPQAPPETAKTRVTGFTYRTPPDEIDPGLRVFRFEPDDTWSVTYPNGTVSRGSRVRARVVLDGCNGTVVGPPDEPEFAVFIPDKGCPGMIARWRRGNSGTWNILGEMQNIH